MIGVKFLALALIKSVTFFLGHPVEAIKTAVNTNLCDENDENIEQVSNTVQTGSHTDEGFQGREANRQENDNHHGSGPGMTLNDSFASDN